MTDSHRRLIVPLVARDPHERHRVSTPLELLFDLCFVVAVAQSSSQLHKTLAAGDFRNGIIGYAMVFIALWWAWMNFTWFASAYDVDDVPYRLNVLVIIAGALVFAAGITRGFAAFDFSVMTAGYVIMRISLVLLWLRAARSVPEHRKAALRYAIGIVLCQAGWIGALYLPNSLEQYAWLVLMPCELLVPMWAEHQTRTTWHPHHIAERYGLLTLIVLGESVLSTAVAIESALDAGKLSVPLMCVAGGGIALLFTFWWIYFDDPVPELLTDNRVGFLWGYGHVFVFAAIAAVGAGLTVQTELVTGHASLSIFAAGACVTVPTAIFLLSVWILQVRPLARGPFPSIAFPAASVLVIASSFSRFSVVISAGICALLLGAWIGSKTTRTTD